MGMIVKRVLALAIVIGVCWSIGRVHLTTSSPLHLLLHHLGTLMFYAFAYFCMVLVIREDNRPFFQKIERGRAAYWLIGVFLCIFFSVVGGELIPSEMVQFTGYKVSNAKSVFHGEIFHYIKLLEFVVIGPWKEELIFRGIFLSGIVFLLSRCFKNRRVVIYIALLSTSIYFGYMHLFNGYYAFFYSTIIGLVSGFLYLRSGGLGLSIYLHMFMNMASSGIIVEKLVSIYWPGSYEDLFSFWWPLVLGGIWCAGLFLVVPYALREVTSRDV